MLSKNFNLLLLFNVILPLIFFIGRDTMGAAVLPDDFTHEQVASGMTGPVGLTFLPDGRILVIEQQGTVRLVVNGILQPGPILDIQAQVRYSGEQGLLGIAVDPEYPTRPFIYLYYTHVTANNQYITRFTMTGTLTDPLGTDLLVDPDSSFYLLTDIPRNASNHNGGTLCFGPDGMLYAGPGDDAGFCVAQLRDDLRGVILRMDVSGLPLDNSVRDNATKSEMVPLDNPFASALNDNERLVWAYGLRNPFRFSIDSVTGNLFIGDVGWDTYEEISMSVAPGGENFGWPYREGYDSNSCCPTCNGDPEPVAETVEPIGGYYHVSGSYSIIGGGVYHPVNYPNDLSWPSEFDGDYFFADYFQGFLIRLKDQGDGTWAVPPPVSGQPSSEYLITGLTSPADFTIGPNGAVYYLSQWDGSINKIGYITEQDISVSLTSHDFGSVNVGSTSSPHTFTVTNMGGKDLIIGTLGITGTGTSEFSIQNYNCSAQTIAASGTCTVDIVFSPTSEGIKSAKLSIPSNDPDTPTLDVPLSGVGGSCTYSISPTSQSFNSDSSTDSISVTAPNSCDWTAISNASWITITLGGSGSGNGNVSYSVSSHTRGSSRTGTITIAGKIFTATQEGTCSYSITPTSQSFSSDGGSGSVDVTATSGCSWTASSNVFWVYITSGGSRSGNGTVNYSILPNTSTSSRNGTMTIAGKTFTVTQAGVGASPAPDVKANGSDTLINIASGDNLLITVELNAGINLGLNADWWVAANVSGTFTIDGWYYFDLSAFGFVFAGDSHTGLNVTHQGTLFNLATFPVLNILVSFLPPGKYTFYFAIETNMNGTLDIDELFFDSVVVNITP